MFVCVASAVLFCLWLCCLFVLWLVVCVVFSVLFVYRCLSCAAALAVSVCVNGRRACFCVAF